MAAALVMGLAALSMSGLAATWTPLTNPPPNGAPASPMRLLNDGTVMIQSGGSQNWLRLTPDAHGSYINGSWTNNPIKPMSAARLYYSSQLLTDGRVWIMGGEYYGAYLDEVWIANGEIWDPVTNVWSPVAPFPRLSCFTVTFNAGGNIVANSQVITGLPTATTPTFLAGWNVAGPGIAPGTTITSVDSSSQVHISTAAEFTAAGVTFQFSGAPASCYGDIISMLLPGGKILTGSLFPETYLYTVATNSWSLADTKQYGDSNDEESWTKLADGRILTYDIWQSNETGESYAQIYDPAKNLWSGASPADGTATGTLPLLSSSSEEIGPSLRLLDGRAFLVGANGHTALYSPSSNSWAAGPDIVGALNGFPALFGADDAPAAITPNGHVMLAADAGPSPVNSTGNITSGSYIISNIPSTALLYVGWAVYQTNGTFSNIPTGATITSIDSPTQIHISFAATATETGAGLLFGGIYSYPTELFDFNPAANTLSPVSPAIPDTGFLNVSGYNLHMLVLPTGQILIANGSNQLWVYTPDGTAKAAYLPVTTNVKYDGAGLFTLTGKQLTGQSAGSAYGDDSQSDENYPIVRLVNSAGDVYYCRTTNWSSVGVAGGLTPQTVNFTLHPQVTAGNYVLIVSAAGISSFPIAINITEAEVNRR